MAGYDKFQTDMAKGRFTFPVAILICLLLRIITGNEWQDVINLLVCALTAYLLIEINTAFTLIRTRSTLHVSFYIFLSTTCLFLHSFQYAVFVPLAFLIATSQLFSSYESPYPAGSIFHAFFFIGLGSLLFPQLLYFVPLFYLGMISFRSLSLKSFFAGLTGLCMPYWLFFGYAFYYDKMNLFYHPLQELIHFQPISYGTLGMDRIISCGIITLISLVSSVHYFHVSYLDKVRTHIFLSFLITVEAWIYLLGILQPQHFDILLQMPLFYLGMISFRSLSLKSFFAGLTGLCMPYWLFFGYAFYYDKMNLFYHPLQELIHFQPISYGTLGMDRIISCGIITLISLVSSVHYFHVSYLDKVRTHIFLSFLITVEAWIYLLGILQPQHFDILLQMQIIVGSILTGHLFTLTHNRFTGIFFIITFVLLIVLTIYNLWMQFFNS